MGCATCREAVSATLDGESPGVPQRWVDEHLDGCLACRGWAEAAAEVTRRARLVVAQQVPDVTAAVLGRLPAVQVRGRRHWVDAVLRVALLAVGAGQLAVSLPAFAGGSMPAPVHLAHETGAWNLGLAACFLGVAVLPRLAAGALPFLLSFTAVLSWVTLRDLGAGHVHADRAVGHLLLLGGALLVSALALRNRAPRTGPVRGRLQSPGAWWTAVRDRAGAGPAAAGRQWSTAVPPVLRAEAPEERAAA
ncbi:putative anti-sigma-YlaC factor YlaD [Modestobacter versicolor]|uniref:Putative anti-sigma-YlaC factor YlaD n=2 Tax=Modestobacter versicolor TaxID=429133 RepID=A0A839Y892_9ACTN|nr:putative anti-sigma-YlaC factor YlaD [Modestobacter versicolor]